MPFQIDPGVAAGSGPQAMLGASSIGPFWRRTMSIYRNRLVASTEKGASAALAYYDALMAAMGSQQSAAIAVQKQTPYIAGLFSTTLTDAAGAAKVAATLARLDKAALTALMTAQIGRTVSLDVTSKQEKVGKLKTTHCRFKLKKMEGLDADLLKRLLRDRARRLLDGRRPADAGRVRQGREGAAVRGDGKPGGAAAGGWAAGRRPDRGQDS